MVYHITDGRGYHKIGYTTNIGVRIMQYFTHNPLARIVETADTKLKTKHQLETAIHNEIADMGYEFITRYNIFTQKPVVTEWFYSETPISLDMFKAMKNRVIKKYPEH